MKYSFWISVLLLHSLLESTSCKWIPGRWVEDTHLENWYKLLEKFINDPDIQDLNYKSNIHEDSKNSDPSLKFRYQEKPQQIPVGSGKSDCSGSKNHYALTNQNSPTQYLSCGCPVSKCVCSKRQPTASPCECLHQSFNEFPAIEKCVTYPTKPNTTYLSHHPVDSISVPITTPSPLSCDCQSHDVLPTTPKPKSSWEGSNYDSYVASVTTPRPHKLPCGCSHHKHDKYAPLPTASTTATPPIVPKLPCGCSHHEHDSYTPLSKASVTTPKPPVLPKLPCGCYQHEHDNYASIQVTTARPPTPPPVHSCKCQSTSTTTRKPSAKYPIPQSEYSMPPSDQKNPSGVYSEHSLEQPEDYHNQSSNRNHTENTFKSQSFIPKCGVPPPSPCVSILQRAPTYERQASCCIQVCPK